MTCPLWLIYLKRIKTTKLVPMGVSSREFVSITQMYCLLLRELMHVNVSVFDRDLIMSILSLTHMYLGCTALVMLVCMYAMCCILYET